MSCSCLTSDSLWNHLTPCPLILCLPVLKFLILPQPPQCWNHRLALSVLSHLPILPRCSHASGFGSEPPPLQWLRQLSSPHGSSLTVAFLFLPVILSPQFFRVSFSVFTLNATVSAHSVHSSPSVFPLVTGINVLILMFSYL